MQLTGLEFRLLEYMMRNRGRTISRQRLLSAVWGYSHQPNTNVVDVSMRRLRQKIGHDRVETVTVGRLPAGRMIVHRAIAWSAQGNRAEWLLGGVLRPLPGRHDRRSTRPLAPIPFHFIYAAVTIVYGLRLWRHPRRDVRARSPRASRPAGSRSTT